MSDTSYNVDEALPKLGEARQFGEWVPVPGYAGLYEASRDGRIRCIPGGRGTRPFPPLREVRGYSRNGYLRFKSLLPEDRGRALNVHVLIATTFHGPPPQGQVVRHLNGDRGDNRAENLKWGTPGENARDMLAHGTHPQARKTNCPKGHPYDSQNTYTPPGSGRKCRTCQANSDRARRAATRKRGLSEGDPKHGTESGYKHFGCRCLGCKQAAADGYQRRKGCSI